MQRQNKQKLSTLLRNLGDYNDSIYYGSRLQRAKQKLLSNDRDIKLSMSIKAIKNKEFKSAFFYFVGENFILPFIKSKFLK